MQADPRIGARTDWHRRAPIRRLWLVLLSTGGSALLSQASPTRAQGTSALQLTWKAPEECPQEADIHLRIEEYLGVGSGPRQAIHAEVSIEKSAGGRYALRLRLAASAGQIERSLSAESCDAVAQAGALLIAMAADPKIAGQTEPAPTAPRSLPRPGAGPHATQAPAASSPATSKLSLGKKARTPSWGVDLGALLDVGSLPGASLGLSAQLVATLAWLRLALGAQVFTPSEGSISQLPTATVDVSAAIAAGQACVPWRGPWLELGPCVFGEAGRLKGRAEGVRAPRSGSALWLALGANLQARLLLGPRWKLRLDAGAVVPNARRRFFVRTDDGTLSVHRVAAAALRVGLGIAYDFE